MKERRLWALKLGAPDEGRGIVLRVDQRGRHFCELLFWPRELAALIASLENLQRQIQGETRDAWACWETEGDGR